MSAQETPTLTLADAPDVLTLQQAAQLMQASEGNLRRLILQGDFPAKKFGSQWRINKRWLIEYLGQ